MDIRLTVNGKEVALSEEQIKLLGLEPEKKKTGYERMYGGGKYFVQNSSGFVTELTDDRLKMCQEQYDAANYYSDFQVCRDNARADKLMRHLRRFAVKNGGIPSLEDWTTTDGSIPCKDKYYIEFNTTIEQLYVTSCNRVRIPGVVYFLSQDACEKAIEAYLDELLWYFTQYEPMLHEGAANA